MLTSDPGAALVFTPYGRLLVTRNPRTLPHLLNHFLAERHGAVLPARSTEKPNAAA